MRATNLLLFPLLLAASPAIAQEPAPAATPQVTTSALSLKIGGTIWPYFRYDLTKDGGDRNELDVGRAYVNLYPSLGEEIGGRITIDIVPGGQGPIQDDTGGTVGSTNTEGSLLLRLKYAYVTYRPVPRIVELEFGMARTPWAAYEEDIWGMRVTGEIGPVNLFGIRTSDFLYGAKVSVLDDRLQVHSTVQNGEGYSRRETSKYKESATRASFRILPGEKGGLELGGYYSFANTGRDAERVRAIGLLSWRSPALTGGAGYVSGHDDRPDAAGDLVRVRSSGPYAFAHVRLPVTVPRLAGIRLLARVDNADPDEETENDAVTRFLAGVQFLADERASMVIDYQHRAFENPDLDPRRELFVRWDLRF